MAIQWVTGALSRFGSRTLAAIFAILFLIDLFVPDPLPFIDELILGVTTLLLARWRGRKPLR